MMRVGLLSLLFLSLFLCNVGQARPAVKSHHPVAVHHGRQHAATHAAGASAKTLVHGHTKLVRRVVYVNGHRRITFQRLPLVVAAPVVASFGDKVGLQHTYDPLELKSNVALVIDPENSQVLFEKNSGIALPIASITKLMTTLIVVEAKQDMDEMIEITDEDIDHEKFTSSRLRPGTWLSRANLMHIALMSSENRAASALARNYPGGLPAAIEAMNLKARSLGMTDTHYVEPTGLSSRNVASAQDLAKLVGYARRYPVLCDFSTDTQYVIDAGGKPLLYSNSNHLVSNPTWEIILQKTGYIAEAGRCLVMNAVVQGRAVIMVFLDSKGKDSRLDDAGRVRKWLEDSMPAGFAHVSNSPVL